MPSTSRKYNLQSAFLAASELNDNKLINRRSSQEKINDKSFDDAVMENSSPDSDISRSPRSTNTSYMIGSSAAYYGGYEMELVTDEEEAQVLYCEETDVVLGREGGSTFNQISDNDARSVEISSEDESDASRYIILASKRDIGGSGQSQDIYQEASEIQVDTGSDDSIILESYSSDSESVEYKEKPFHSPDLKSASSQNCCELINREIVRSEEEQSERNSPPEDETMDVPEEDDSEEMLPLGFGKDRKSFDKFDEGTEKFLRIDRRRTCELSLRSRLISESVARNIEMVRSGSYSDDDKVDLDGDADTPGLCSQKPIIDKQTEAHDKELLYGDRAPSFDHELASKHQIGLDGRVEVDTCGLEAESVNESMTDHRLSGQLPTNLSMIEAECKHYDSKLEHPVDSNLQASDSPHLDVTSENNNDSIRPSTESSSESKTTSNGQFVGKELSDSNSGPSSYSPESQKVNFHKLHSEGAEQDMSAFSQYINEYGQLNEQQIHRGHFIFDMFHAHPYLGRFPGRPFLRGSYNMNLEARIPYGLLGAQRFLNWRNEFMQRYHMGLSRMYGRGPMLPHFERAEGPVFFGNGNLGMQHQIRANLRQYHHAALEETLLRNFGHLPISENHFAQPQICPRPMIFDHRDIPSGPFPVEGSSPILNGGQEGNGCFGLAESMKARQDFIERHFRDGMQRYPIVHFGTPLASHRYNFSNPIRSHFGTDNDMPVGRHHYASIPEYLALPEVGVGYSESFRNNVGPDEDRDEVFLNDSTPLELIYLRRMNEERLKLLEDRSGERPFFGELLGSDNHLHTRSASDYVYLQFDKKAIYH